MNTTNRNENEPSEVKTTTADDKTNLQKPSNPLYNPDEDFEEDSDMDDAFLDESEIEEDGSDSNDLTDLNRNWKNPI